MGGKCNLKTNLKLRKMLYWTLNRKEKIFKWPEFCYIDMLAFHSVAPVILLNSLDYYLFVHTNN